MNHRRSIFTDIYVQKKWRGRKSVSGPGSDLEETVAIRIEFPLLIQKLGVRTLLDAPCGDFNWMQALNCPLEQYVGMDIVPELILNNEKLYQSPKRRFIVGDIVEDKLPCVDLILCRDCLAHLPITDVLKAIQKFKDSGATYLAATTFPRTAENKDVATWWAGDEVRTVFQPGDYHALNLQSPPFNLPAPIAMIDERNPDGKMLGVWNLKDI